MAFSRVQNTPSRLMANTRLEDASGPQNAGVRSGAPAADQWSVDKGVAKREATKRIKDRSADGCHPDIWRIGFNRSKRQKALQDWMSEVAQEELSHQPDGRTLPLSLMGRKRSVAKPGPERDRSDAIMTQQSFVIATAVFIFEPRFFEWEFSPTLRTRESDQ